MESRLYKKYKDEVKPALQTERGYANVHQIPGLDKIVVRMGVDATLEKSALDDAVKDMTTITGRKPVIDVTLRREVMWEFMDRLTTAALPRIRDFRGINPRGFDGHGNYSMGVSDQSIFPEIELDKVKRTQGMDITFVTTAKTNDEAKDLLTKLGMPFAKK